MNRKKVCVFLMHVSIIVSSFPFVLLHSKVLLASYVFVFAPRLYYLVLWATPFSPSSSSRWPPVLIIPLLLTNLPCASLPCYLSAIHEALS